MIYPINLSHVIDHSNDTMMFFWVPDDTNTRDAFGEKTANIKSTTPAHRFRV